MYILYNVCHPLPIILWIFLRKNKLFLQRLSEMCCLAVSQLLVLGKSVISAANKSKNEDDENDVKIDWPEDPISKAKIIRWKVQSISVDMEKVSTSFATGNCPLMIIVDYCTLDM